MKQLLVWGVIGFAAYSGFAYLGVSMSHRQIEGAIENVLEQGSHKVPDATIRTKAHTAATSLDVSLEKGQILVSRERRATRTPPTCGSPTRTPATPTSSTAAPSTTGRTERPA